MDKDLKGQVTFSGSVTINGPMFDIHDNERVELHNHYEGGVCARDKDKIQPLGVSSLNIPEDVWERLHEAGKVDENFVPCGTNTETAVLAEVLSDKFGIDRWAPFERAWGKKPLRNFWQRAIDQKQYSDLTDKFRKIVGC